MNFSQLASQADKRVCEPRIAISTFKYPIRLDL